MDLFQQYANARTLAGKFLLPDVATRYILAGAATITLRSAKTQERFTYKIQAGEKAGCHLVSVLVGSNNEDDYKFLGCIFQGTKFVRPKSSRIPAGSVSHVAFEWSWSKLASGKIPNVLEVWHEGACGRCGRKLTVPESIRDGFGPECRKRVGL